MDEDMLEHIAFLEGELATSRSYAKEVEAAIEEIKSSPEYNVFSSLDEAEDMLYGRLHSAAAEACEGAGNVGEEKYTQEFIVDGIHYIGTLTVSYNRYDKTYYYIDEAEFTFTKKE